VSKKLKVDMRRTWSCPRAIESPGSLYERKEKGKKSKKQKEIVKKANMENCGAENCQPTGGGSAQGKSSFKGKKQQKSNDWWGHAGGRATWVARGKRENQQNGPLGKMGDSGNR